MANCCSCPLALGHFSKAEKFYAPKNQYNKTHGNLGMSKNRNQTINNKKNQLSQNALLGTFLVAISPKSKLCGTAVRILPDPLGGGAGCEKMQVEEGGAS